MDSQPPDPARPLNVLQNVLKKLDGPPVSPSVHERYRRIRVHGAGNLGCVWIAEDQLLQRVVALKEMRSEVRDDAAARRRFLAEARISARLEHPFIPSVHDLDANDVSPYYAMRFVSGRTLGDAVTERMRLRKTGASTVLELRTLLRNFVAVCHAVDYAHSQGVIHRDLKPANIMLGQFGEVFVVDWGLAKVVGLSASESADSLTAFPEAVRDTPAGGILGTPAFMAPEQASGDIDAIDCRTDVYALGAILFAILVGESPHDRLPFGDKKAFFASVAGGKIPKTTTIDAATPPALEAICAHALNKERNARYLTASRLADDVTRWLDGEPVSVYREPWPQRTARWILRRPRIAVAAGILLLGLFIAVTSLGAFLAFRVQSAIAERCTDQADQINLVHAILSARTQTDNEQTLYLSREPITRTLLRTRMRGDVAAADQSKAAALAAWNGWIEARPTSARVALFDRDGLLVAAAAKILDWPDEEDRAALTNFAKLARECQWGRVLSVPLKGSPNGDSPLAVAVRIGAPVVDDGQVTGAMVVEMDLPPLLRSRGVGGIAGDEFYIADSAGAILSISDSKTVVARPAHATTMLQLFPESAPLFQTETNVSVSNVSERYVIFGDQIFSARKLTIDTIEPSHFVVIAAASSRAALFRQVFTHLWPLGILAGLLAIGALSIAVALFQVLRRLVSNGVAA